jgi:hypothetical protein
MLKQLQESKLLIKKYEKALNLLSKEYNEQKKFVLKNKYIVPIRLAGFSLKETKALGFNVKKFSWDNCLKKKSNRKYFKVLIIFGLFFLYLILFNNLFHSW